LKIIALTKDKFATVDNEDFEFLVNFASWFCNNQGSKKLKYRAVSTKDYKTYYMHRVIMERVYNRKLRSTETVDHIDGDPLNNTRKNLRVCTKKNNTRYKVKTTSECTSKYKGVCWQINRKKWFSQIKVNSKTINLGYFINEKDAAKCYDSAANFYFGEFSILNFPNEVVEYKPKNKHQKTSKYKWVSYIKSNNKWLVQITLGGDRYSVSRETEEDAKNELDNIIINFKKENL